MHVLCGYALKLVFGFFWLFWDNVRTFFGKKGLTTMLLIIRAEVFRLIVALTEAN